VRGGSEGGIEKICEEVEMVVQRLQEVVEFVSRTKAANQGRDVRLKDARMTLKVLYEREVDEMRFEGMLDQALLHVQDEFGAVAEDEAPKHEGSGAPLWRRRKGTGSEMEVQF